MLNIIIKFFAATIQCLKLEKQTFQQIFYKNKLYIFQVEFDQSEQ